MHRVVISSIRNHPPGIGVYLELLTVILRFLLVVRELCKIGAASSMSGSSRIADFFFSNIGPDCKEGPKFGSEKNPHSATPGHTNNLFRPAV